MTNLSYLIFKLHESLYGIDTTYIHEIVELPELKRTNEMPAFLAGLLNYHGEMIEILNMNFLLNLPCLTYSLNDFVIILKGSHFTLGFITSSILDVTTLSQKEILSHSSDERQQVSEWRTELVDILDIDMLIKRIENSSSQHSLENRIEFQGDAKDRSILTLRAQTLMQPLKEKISESLIPLTIVMLKQKYFGIDPQIIKELIPMDQFTPIPRAPPHLLGFFNFRGNALTLIDICPLIKMEKLEITPQSQILIVDLDRFLVGVAIDRILNFIHFQSTDFQPPPIMLDKSTANCFAQQIVIYEKNVICILDIFKVLDQI